MASSTDLSVTIADLEDLRQRTSSLAIHAHESDEDEPVSRFLKLNVPAQVLQHADMSKAGVRGFQEGIKLFPHQVVARTWMEQRECGDNHGGILADDMGLGKTMEMLVRIVDGRPPKAAKAEGWAASTLVVCPVGLLSQWASEIRRIVPQLLVIQHHGPDRAIDNVPLQRAHVVITSYSVAMSEWGNMQAEKHAHDQRRKAAKSTSPSHQALFHVQWWRIVLDEAHTIKNRESKTSLACCALAGKHHWCLTGTLIQNHVAELYPFFKFLQLKPFGDWAVFSRDIVGPIRSGQNQVALSRLQAVMTDIMLRRRKDEYINGQPILHLPKRIVEVVTCDFSLTERAFYDALQFSFASHVDKLVQDHIAKKFFSSVLEMVTRLRQACNHPSLVNKASKFQGTVDLDGIVAKVIGPFESASTRTESGLPPISTKICAAVELLCQIVARGEKTIVFSQFTSMLDILEPFLRFNNIRFVRYDGSMTKENRQKALDSICSSALINCILISFKAGNTGLNLTACNNVILIDLWWNPALEDQAFDRAHRVGQTKDVHIYKLTVKDTVEERILKLQDRKCRLARAALEGEGLESSELGLDELIGLFRDNTPVPA